MNCRYVLTIDLGASSGRGIVFACDQDGIHMVHEKRFANGIVTLGGTAYWDFLYLFKNIKEAIREAAHAYPIASIGIDTWGLDFGLIDEAGDLLANPVSYRDVRTNGVPARLHRQIPAEELYQETGTQYLEGNTIYQLRALQEKKPELLEHAAHLLMMPDLIRYYLTGCIQTEYTIATTTGLFDIRKGDWNRQLIGRLGLPERLFSEICFPGESAIALSAEVQAELQLPPIPVVTTAAHDTASAVISVPAQETDFLYISSGTWSILGTEQPGAVVNEKCCRASFTNEGGFHQSIRFARSLMGMWLIQECVRSWSEEGQTVSYPDIEACVAAAPAFASIIDPQSPEIQGRCNMPVEIAALCRRAGRKAPQAVGETARCIYESMALNYRRCLDALSGLNGKHYDKLYVIGGGAQSAFLNQCISNATGLRVEAGITEATAFGNAFAQLYWLGDLASLSAYRALLRKGESGLRSYAPKDQALWTAAYADFLKAASGAHAGG